MSETPAPAMTRDDVMRETCAHVRRVGTLLMDVVGVLQTRAINHDASKFSPEEFESFALETPNLKGLTYGSDEYRAALRRIKPAIDAHYSKNSHHPEYWPGGIHDMSAVDLIEMLADWKAAGERHANGSLGKSIRINAERFKYDAAMMGLLARTAHRLGWISNEEKLELDAA